MNETTWKTVVMALQSLKDIPPWLQQVAGLNFEQMMLLPQLDIDHSMTFARPHITNETVKADYLDFLREQIRLKSRGPEWDEILKSRLNALEPFVGKKVLTAHFYYKIHSATLRLNPETGEFFHIEFDE